MDNSNNSNRPSNPNPLPPDSQNPLSQTTPTASMPSSQEPSTPSFNAPQDNVNPNLSTTPNLGTSPLDNPWGAPLQPTDSSYPSSPQPTWTPSSEQTQNPLAYQQATPTPESNPPLIQTDSAPTDLSHLIGNNNGIPVAEESNNQPAAETLVVPPNAAPEVPNLPTETHKGIPKWLIGIGMGLLVIIAGVSAYFILGIGQSTQQTTSIPAEVAKPTIKTPPPITPSTPAPAAQAAATGSASFGELQEGSQPPQATSAAERLRQRQQGQ